MLVVPYSVDTDFGQRVAVVRTHSLAGAAHMWVEQDYKLEWVPDTVGADIRVDKAWDTLQVVERHRFVLVWRTL